MQGSCHCGTVRYEIMKFGQGLGNCWCNTCRKTHAAAFATTTRVAREDFRWLAGRDRLTAYESSPGKTRYFCSVCGCHIVADRPEQPYVILRAASLDGDPGIRPVVNIWTSHAPPWLKSSEETPSYPEVPPARQP